MRIRYALSRIKLPLRTLYRCSSSDFKLLSSCSHPFAGKDVSSITDYLSVSASSGSLFLGAQVHGKVIKLGFTGDTFARNKLIEMYLKCGILNDGLKVFDEMPERNLVSWTLLVSGSARNGEPELGLGIFLDMKRHGFVPNEFALSSVIKICINLSAYEMGTSMHSFLVKVGMETNPFVGSSLLSLYAKFGCIEEAKSIFLCLEDNNVDDIGCWNAMIGGYAECGYGMEALEAVAKLLAKWQLYMDEFTMINALKGSSLVGNLNYGIQLHGLIICSQIQFSISLFNALIDMYIKIREMESALKIFEKMPEKDIITWNTILGGFSQVDEGGSRLGIFFHKFMFSGIRPNHITFSVLFRCCRDIQNLNLGLQFCSLALRLGFFTCSDVSNSVLSMLSRCGEMALAHKLIGSSLFEGNTDNWNELISGYNNINNAAGEALYVILDLHKSGVKANECTLSNILETCCGFGNERMARQIHGAIVKLGFSSYGYVCSSLVKVYATFNHHLYDALQCLTDVKKPDVVCWGTLISTLIHHGRIDESIISLKSLMKYGEDPDEFILGSIFSGCADLSSYTQTKCIHSLTTKIGSYDRHNVFVASAIIDAYAKCGDIPSARAVFNHSSKPKDVVIFNSLIMAYSINGLILEAINIFEQMKQENTKPSQATFVAVISGCSHMGFVDQGCALFRSMISHHRIEPSPDIYGCVVDMLSRNGYLGDAKSVIEAMPVPPWPSILRSLLSGSRLHGNIGMSKWAAEKLLELVPENDAAHVLMTKVYSEVGSWEDAADMQRSIEEKGISKCPGHSWIQLE